MRRLRPCVNDLVAKGRYNSKSEVLREGLRLVQEREAALAQMYAAIDRGIADADAGRVSPAEDVFAEMRSRYGAADAKVD